MKKLFALVISCVFCVSTFFSQSYEEWLKKAKEYENQKRWCYALGAYYDAMGTDEKPEKKQEAYEGYKTLKDEILSGNPGKGKYNVFTIHDEWKNLLIDAEKYGSSNNMYEISIGELKQGDLDYTTKTATYSAELKYQKGNRYNNTIKIIKEGYNSAYKSDWTDLPKEWPIYSASAQDNNKYNINGALIYARDFRDYGKGDTCYLNAFAMYDNDIWQMKTPGLYDYKFNIIDENGKEIVKGKRWLLGENNIISFSGISPEIMDFIDNGKAYVNPVACYLEYGKFNREDNKGGRSFIKNFPEVQIPLNKNDFLNTLSKENITKKNVNLAMISHMKNFNMVYIEDLGIEISSTEITQELYEIVMEERVLSSEFQVQEELSDNKPAFGMSWYDAIYFCNKLSEMKGYSPVYSVNGSANIDEWDYIPHRSYSIKDPIEQNELADGFRLPTKFEWGHAARSSSITSDEAWIKENSNNHMHPVAQKKPNEYGLYDMQGNVSEWCWDIKGKSTFGSKAEICGEDYYSHSHESSLMYVRAICVGFRVVRNTRK